MRFDSFDDGFHTSSGRCWIPGVDMIKVFMKYDFHGADPSITFSDVGHH
jgi:hypothetical protein